MYAAVLVTQLTIRIISDMETENMVILFFYEFYDVVNYVVYRAERALNFFFFLFSPMQTYCRVEKKMVITYR